MAYGLLLYKEITAPEGKHRLEIYKDGYSGTSAEINSLVRDSIVLSKSASEFSDAIVTSVLTFAMYDTGQLDYSQFFTPSATLYQVVLKFISGNTTTTRWTGFITPDSYSENLASHDTITLTARDNLGRLNDYDFSLTRGQMLSVRSIINSGLSVAGVAMTTTFTTAKLATSPASTLAVDGLVNTSLLQGMTWHEALTLLLEGLGMTLAWNEGNTFEVRDITQAPSSTQEAFFIQKSGYRQIRPAWKNLTVDQDYGLRENFYEGQFSREDCGSSTTFTPGSGSLWTVGGSVSLLNPYVCGAASPLESLFPPVSGSDTLTNSLTYTFHAPTMDRAIKMAFKVSNSAWRPGVGRGGTWAQPKIVVGQSQGQSVSRYYYLRYRFNIFATVGTTKYVLRESWEMYDPSTIEEPYLYFIMPGTEQGVDVDNEVTFYIAPLTSAADIDLVVYPPVAQTTEDGDPITTVGTGNYGRLTDIAFTVDEGVGGRTQKITVNAAHNVQDAASFRIGRVPTGLGNALLYLGGLFYSDGDYTPLNTYKRGSSETDTYDLLELVARERISFNNDNYNQLSGTMKAAAAFSFAKGISFEETDYRIVSASLSVLSNTLQVQAMQTEPEFADAEYTIEEVNSEGGYSSRGTYSGGSVPQGPQGGGYWERIDETNITTAYDINIVVPGSGSGSGSGSGAASYKNVSAILRHLSLQVLNAGETNEEMVLVSDITFASQKAVVAGGIGTGGGGAAGSLATLVDVTLTNLAGGDILKYNATSSHWENTPLVLSALADVSLGTPGNGQALVYSSTLGKWVPGTVASGATVVSEDATIGTSLTTLATVDGTAIKAKIASYLLASSFSAANIVSTLGNTAVNRATGDESGNNIKSTYAVGLYVYQNKLYLKSKSNELLSGYVDGSDIVSVIGNNAVARASADASGNTIASQTWVGNQGFLTSSDLSGYATQTWVTNQGYITSVTVSNESATIGTSLTTIATVDGTAIKAKIDSYLLASSFTAANIVSTLGNTAVNRATGDESGNNIKSTYAAGLYVYQNNLYLKSKSNELLTAYVDGSDLVTVIGTNAVARATADASGNAFATSYLRKDIDDTMSGNLTIGTSSAKKTLTIRGTTGEALIIYGNSYYTELYCNASGLHISNDAKVYGNFVATGNVTAGSASDRRLKKNIRSITLAEAADLLMVLNPVVFEWNDKAGKLGQLSGVSRGFLADEYLDLIPNAGRKIWGIYDAIDYVQTIPYLVAGWQQQNLRIRELESEIEDMRRRLREHGIQ